MVLIVECWNMVGAGAKGMVASLGMFIRPETKSEVVKA
jgi:hypothetical protein